MLKKLVLLVSLSILFTVAAVAQGSDSAKAATTTAAADTAKPAAFRPTKDQIKQGQEVLIKEKLYTGQATGVYGDSRDAIKAYQKAHGLDVNGKFDRATLGKMGIALTDKQNGMATATTAKASNSDSSKTSPAKTTTGGPSPSASDGPKRPAPFRASVDQIKAAQKILRDGKMLTGGEDGKLDDMTRDGLKKYQDANKIKVTGTLNAATLDKMGIALSDAQKANVAAQAAYDAAKPKAN